MITRRTYLKRSGPPRKRRSTPRRGQPTAAEKAAIRLTVYERAQGLCELKLGPKCIQGVLPFEGRWPYDVWCRGHLVHVRSRGAGGKWTMENCRWGCFECHLGYAHTEGRKIA